MGSQTAVRRVAPSSLAIPLHAGCRSWQPRDSTYFPVVLIYVLLPICSASMSDCTEAVASFLRMAGIAVFVTSAQEVLPVLNCAYRANDL